MTSATRRFPDVVLFGATGDLAARMLFPSLFLLDVDGHLPEDLRIIAVARGVTDPADFVGPMADTVLGNRHVKQGITGDGRDQWQRFANRLTVVDLDATDVASYQRLRNDHGLTPEQPLLYYLAMPPALYGTICGNLREAGLVGPDDQVVMEKPIGLSAAGAETTNAAVAETFDEAAIYRIDHYLGKETVQNLLALRFANVLFEPLWNRNGIKNIQITVAESVGCGGRFTYYDSSGALRDMVQNHMLQLLCLVAMEPPDSLTPDAVSSEKLKVLRSLRPIGAAEVKRKTVRGQYSAGAIDGQPVPGYLEEADADPASTTETFVALKAQVDNWRWKGVPFYLRTGKRLARQCSEIVVEFRSVPHSIFPGEAREDIAGNRMIIRLQPDEEVTLSIVNKVPGIDGVHLQGLPLNLSRTEAFDAYRPGIAYERLILDALHGNKTLFVRRDEVAAAWEWVDGIIDGWQQERVKPNSYSAGSWGPSAAYGLTERTGHSWHEPE